MDIVEKINQIKEDLEDFIFTVNTNIQGRDTNLHVVNIRIVNTKLDELIKDLSEDK